MTRAEALHDALHSHAEAVGSDALAAEVARCLLEHRDVTVALDAYCRARGLRVTS
jgi:hypothetical protein